MEDGGFLLLFLGVSAMFWGLAAVCEEYFVPALNILCEELNIPEDVAGATFMAAGASSPEMFTAFIALFVDHSTLGVGTVVGSEIFNHMMICAGSVYFSENGTLYLDKYVFSRDVVAYFFSLIVLLWAIKGNLSSSFANMFASGVENECLSVTIWHATGLLLLYFAYVVVAGNFESFLKKFNLVHRQPTDENGDVNQPIEERSLDEKEIRDVDEEAQTQDNASGDKNDHAGKSTDVSGEEEKGQLNVSSTQHFQILGCDDESVGSIRAPHPQSVGIMQPSLVEPKQEVPTSNYSYRSFSGAMPHSSWSQAANDRPEVSSEKRRRAMSNFVKDQAMFAWRLTKRHHRHPDADNILKEAGKRIVGPAGSRYHACLHAIGSEAGKNEMIKMEISQRSLSGYLFINSNFLEMSSSCCSLFNTWRLRYFTVDNFGMHSRKFRQGARKGPQIEVIDLQTCRSLEVIDRSRGLFALRRTGQASYFDSHDYERPYLFAATSLELMDEVIERLTLQLELARARPREEQKQFNEAASIELEGEYHLEDKIESHTSLLTAPDFELGSVRSMLSTSWHYFLFPLKFCLHYTLPDVMQKGGRKKFVRCLFVSIVWLALQSYVMIKCCDGLGNWIGTSPTVMGLTLSAVGTCFPNMWSSILVARQGFGNMAVCNAFGSNTFNICIALGLPWFFLVLISGHSYDKMRDNGIAFMILLLASVLVLFYLLVLFNDWRLHYWMAYLFVATYFAVMCYAVLHG